VIGLLIFASLICGALKGGGAGIGDVDCAQVDVWIPADMANAQQAPTINDPNAIVTLDITPSPTGSDCQTWHWHYLRKGEKAPARKAVPRRAGGAARL
jgi:hypothetical protein